MQFSEHWPGPQPPGFSHSRSGAGGKPSSTTSSSTLIEAAFQHLSQGLEQLFVGRMNARPKQQWAPTVYTIQQKRNRMETKCIVVKAHILNSNSPGFKCHHPTSCAPLGKFYEPGISLSVSVTGMLTHLGLQWGREKKTVNWELNVSTQKEVGSC